VPKANRASALAVALSESDVLERALWELLVSLEIDIPAVIHFENRARVKVDGSLESSHNPIPIDLVLLGCALADGAEVLDDRRNAEHPRALHAGVLIACGVRRGGSIKRF